LRLIKWLLFNSRRVLLDDLLLDSVLAVDAPYGLVKVAFWSHTTHQLGRICRRRIELVKKGEIVRLEWGSRAGRAKVSSCLQTVRLDTAIDGARANAEIACVDVICGAHWHYLRGLSV